MSTSEEKSHLCAHQHPHRIRAQPIGIWSTYIGSRRKIQSSLSCFQRCSAGPSFAKIYLNYKNLTLEGVCFGCESVSLKLFHLFISEEIMICRGSNIKVGEFILVFLPIIRWQVVGLKKVLNLFINFAVISFQEGNFFYQIESERVSCGYIIEWHFQTFLPTLLIFHHFVNKLQIYLSCIFREG